MANAYKGPCDKEHNSTHVSDTSPLRLGKLAKRTLKQPRPKAYVADRLDYNGSSLQSLIKGQNAPWYQANKDGQQSQQVSWKTRKR